jgi:hypothetical protein
VLWAAIACILSSSKTTVHARKLCLCAGWHAIAEQDFGGRMQNRLSCQSHNRCPCYGLAHTWNRWLRFSSSRTNQCSLKNAMPFEPCFAWIQPGMSYNDWVKRLNVHVDLFRVFSTRKAFLGFTERATIKKLDQTAKGYLPDFASSLLAQTCKWESRRLTAIALKCNLIKLSFRCLQLRTGGASAHQRCFV